MTRVKRPKLVGCSNKCNKFDTLVIKAFSLKFQLNSIQKPMCTFVKDSRSVCYKRLDGSTCVTFRRQSDNKFPTTNVRGTGYSGCTGYLSTTLIRELAVLQCDVGFYKKR